jgi:indolepyruvate ferredoxin oxidoreductase, beta subunit
MSAERPITVLISALGGQGGGLLVEWLSEAAHLAGYPAQATSTPGVAQRTGGTTYYFEIYPERGPGAVPLFCLFPSSGEVDLVAALEPVEAARALQNGYVDRNTTVVTLRGRIYGISEKIVPGDATIPARTALDALARAGKRLIALDAASEVGGQGNALLFGALANSGVLPLSLDECRRAIETVGVAPRVNLAGFERGVAAATAPPETATESEPALLACPSALSTALAALPARHRPVIAHAAARLVDYQDGAYAERYLNWLAPIARIDTAGDEIPADKSLTGIVARRLAAWMMYEDVIRVAQLKTRPGRLQRIRVELGAKAGESVVVTDFLKPGRDELRGVLPNWLGRLLPPGRPGQRRRGLALKLSTSRPWGYGVLKMLASLRWWRPHTARFAEEQHAIDAWLGAVAASACQDAALARGVAELAVFARGYGDVRARGLRRLTELLEGWSARLATDTASLTCEVAATLNAARSEPDAGCAPV